MQYIRRQNKSIMKTGIDLYFHTWVSDPHHLLFPLLHFWHMTLAG